MSDYNIPVSGGVNGLNVPLHGHIAVYNKEFPVIPNPEGEVTGYVTKLGFTPEILQVKDPEVHDWARAEEKPTYTKAEVGLGNVDNTSDLNKPISTATQTALDGKVDKVPGKALSTNDYTDTDKAIVDGVTSALATKVDKIAGKGLSSNDYTDYEKSKLAYIQSGAEVNVQADWFESNRWSDAFILNKPTKLSDFSNDTGFITSTVDNLTYYYKKSETYTQAEVNALIGSIVTISFLVVQTLPQTGEANIIYLVPADEPNPDNIYEEYIYVNDDWEMIGTTKVDLSNYYTKTETDNLLSAKADSSSVYTKTETDTALGNKVDKVSGKGLSTNDYDDTAKGIVEGVTSALDGKVDKDGDKVLSDNNYSDTDKTKLDGIEEEANKTVVDTEISATSTNPLQNKAIYDLLNDLLPESTETGNPITISNASGFNAKALTVDMLPIQDLHGYDKPWAGGSGKNIFPTVADGTYSNNGITIVAKNGVLTFSGTSTASGAISIDFDNTYIFPSSDTFDFCFMNTVVTGSISMYLRRTGADIHYWSLGVENRIIDTWASSVDESYSRLVFSFGNGVSANGTVSPMLVKKTETDKTHFAPYSNICPISGRTQTTVSVNSADTTVQFGQTVYGGTCDVVNGGTSDEWIIFDLGDYNWTYYTLGQEPIFYCQFNLDLKTYARNVKPEAFCTVYPNTYKTNSRSNICIYMEDKSFTFIENYPTIAIKDFSYTNATDFKNAMQGVKVCCKLATPTTLTTPATPISLNKGNNTLSTSGDNMDLKYSKIPQ